jgi:TonB dependent receptor
VVLGGFVQDEVRVRPNLSLSVGLRYDWQNHFNHDNNNFAPRFSFAYAPGNGGKTVVRGGFGTFYDRTGPGPISDVIRFDGQRLRQYVITSPCFPDPLCGDQVLAAQPSGVVRLAPDVIIPFTAQYGVGVERQLLQGLMLTVGYIGMRGVDLFRSRDVNAPLPPLFAARPDPDFSVMRQIESTGRLTSNALEVGLRGQLTPYFNGMIQYVFGRAWNDTSGIAAFPASSYDLSGEWGRADFDVRHRLNLLGTLKAGKYFNLGMALTLNTGPPYTLTTGRDDNKDGQALDRPAGVGRNTLEGPDYAQLDLRWSRDFFLVKAKKDHGPTLTAAVDAFNVSIGLITQDTSAT